MKIFRPICLLAIAAVVSGCAGTMTLSQSTAHTREKLLDTFIGMPKQEVIDLFGTKPNEVVNPARSSSQELLAINNPYRLETIQGNGKNLEVIYYVTDDKDNNDTFSNEELTPLVFDDGKLVGWGWGYLVSDEQKFEITVK